MADKVKRIKTKDRNIYQNLKTKLYDVKYNYKEYSPTQGKNVYKAKWIYGCASITEAKAALANLQSGGVREDDKEVTLAGIVELWKTKAVFNDYSIITIHNTEQYMKSIYKYLPADTKLKNITADVYYNLVVNLKKEYSPQTVSTLDKTFRKLIKYAYRQELITKNFLEKTEKVGTAYKNNYRLITHDEFKQIDNYLADKADSDHGQFPRLRFLYNILYYTGMRLGEVLALTWQDFKELNYYSATDRKAKKDFRLLIEKTTDKEHLSGYQISVTKAVVKLKDENGQTIVKEPKNKKYRTIPVPSKLEVIYYAELDDHLNNGKKEKDTDRIFNYGPSYVSAQLTNICKDLEIKHCTCHSFRHTYISNLIKQSVPIPVIEKVSGDTQAIILRHYSHMFEKHEIMVLNVFENFE